MIASIVIAIKFYDDTFYDNEFYSKVGGVSCAEMNVLEAEMLGLLNYGLWVEAEEYGKYKERIERLYAQCLLDGQLKEESKRAGGTTSKC